MNAWYDKEEPKKEEPKASPNNPKDNVPEAKKGMKKGADEKGMKMGAPEDLGSLAPAQVPQTKGMRGASRSR